jgi:hypothetical protein
MTIDNNKDTNTKPTPTFTLDIKSTPPSTPTPEPTPSLVSDLPPASKYRRFRHAMYVHLHNKYIMAVVLGVIALLIVIGIGILIKHLG